MSQDLTNDPLAKFFGKIRSSREGGGSSGGNGEPRLFVLDTNIIMNHPWVLLFLLDGSNGVLVPWEVLSELQAILDRSEAGGSTTAIRDFFRFLDDVDTEGNLGEGGVVFSNPLSGVEGWIGSDIWVPGMKLDLDQKQRARLESALQVNQRVKIDHLVICLADWYRCRCQDCGLAKVVLLTDDKPMRVLCRALAPRLTVQPFQSSLDSRQQQELTRLNAHLLGGRRATDQMSSVRGPLEVHVPSFMIRQLDKTGFAYVTSETLPFLGLRPGKIYRATELDRPVHNRLAVYETKGDLCWLAAKDKKARPAASSAQGRRGRRRIRRH